MNVNNTRKMQVQRLPVLASLIITLGFFRVPNSNRAEIKVLQKTAGILRKATTQKCKSELSLHMAIDYIM